MRESGHDPDQIQRIDATINYRANRVLLFHLPDAKNDLSAAETLAHETLHAVLDQIGERWAARSLDFVAKTAGDPLRLGGV